jgi:kinetochore protein Spc25, fungi type
MRIEGAGVTDRLKIVYTHIIDSDWTKEFSFIINMVTRDYEGKCCIFSLLLLYTAGTHSLLVIQCRPSLDREVVGRSVDKLNETRDFVLFLKEMRQLFKEQACSSGE